MKEPVVEFIAQSKEFKQIFDPPVPASTMVPEWYKRMDSFIGDMVVSEQTGNANRTIKACMPVFDVLTAGYIFKIPAEIFIEKTNDVMPKTSWSVDRYKLIDSHTSLQFSEFKVPENHYPFGLKFHNVWVMKTPPGYSTLFMQPAMRDDLPYQIIPAIVDTDKHPSPVNFPFFMHKDYEGILTMDMPMVQAIPFKRENWTHQISHYENDEGEMIWQNAKRKILNRYKHYFRTPKSWK
jgi:hypothetical protein